MSSTPADRPVLRFPGDVLDRQGRRLRPGSVVRVTSGPHEGEVGEVIGWGGTRGVEMLVETEPPVTRALRSDQLEVIAHVLSDPVTPGVVVVSGSEQRYVVVVPVGGQDVQPRSTNPGPFPGPAQFTTTRGHQTKVDARSWGQACLDVLVGEPDPECEALVAAHLDAPMLTRVLNEGALPAAISRLVFVVTDQASPHRDDTEPFGRLMALWVKGTARERLRVIEEVAEPIVLRSAPHIVSAVALQVEPEMERTMDGCTGAVVVHAGGTPAMIYGTLMSYVEAGVEVRHIQVPLGQPVMEIDLKAIGGRRL